LNYDAAMTEENGPSSMCSSCNKEINTADRFCQNCGAMNAAYKQLPDKRISGFLGNLIAIVIFGILFFIGQVIASVVLMRVLGDPFNSVVSGMLGILLGALGVRGWNKWNSFP